MMLLFQFSSLALLAMAVAGQQGFEEGGERQNQVKYFCLKKLGKKVTNIVFLENARFLELPVSAEAAASGKMMKNIQFAKKEVCSNWRKFQFHAIERKSAFPE